MDFIGGDQGENCKAGRSHERCCMNIIRRHHGKRAAGRIFRQRRCLAVIAVSIIILSGCSMPSKRCAEISIVQSVSTQHIVVPSTTPRQQSEVQHSLNIKCVLPSTSQSEATLPYAYIKHYVRQILTPSGGTEPSSTSMPEKDGAGQPVLAGKYGGE